MAWNKPSVASTPSPTPKRKPTALRGVVAGFIVVAVAAVVAFVLLSGGDAKPKAKVVVERKTEAIKEVRPAAAPKYDPKDDEIDRLKKIDGRNLERAKRLAKMTPEERLDFLFQEAQARPIDLTPTTNRPFRTGTEVQLARIFCTEPGDMPPPLLPIPIDDEAHMAEIIVANNPVIDGDSDRVAAEKGVVEAAKKELKKFIKEGGDVSEFMAYYHGMLDEAFQKRMQAQESVMKMVHEDPDIAEAYYNEVNKKLEADGIKPTIVPPAMRQHLGWKDE